MIIIVMLASAALLGAARLAGRGTTPKLAVVQAVELLRSDIVTYGIIDLHRDAVTWQTIDVAGFGGANFDHFPPLVLQSTPNENTTTWTLNILDVWSGTLTPEMRIETSPRDRLNAAMFRQEAGDRWIYHDFTQGELYHTRSGELDAEFVQAAPIGSTFWSNDLTQFAVEGAGFVAITDLETGDMNIIMRGAGPQAVIRWSPDDRYIAVSSRFPSNTMGQVIDVESHETVLEIEGDGLRWCGDRLIYTADTGGGIYEVRRYDLETGTEDILLTRDLSDIPVSVRTLTVADLNGQPCEWLLLFIGREQAALVHIESGKTISFSGSLIQPYNVVDGAVTYLVEDARKTELRRIVLDTATENYEVLASLDLLSTSLTWIDAERGAVYLRNGQLRRIEPDTGKEILLPGSGIQTFYLIP